MRISATIINSAMPPQKGRVTHHQDQLITPTNLRTTNETPKSPITPIPDLEPELFAMLLYFLSANIRTKYVENTHG